MKIIIFGINARYVGNNTIQELYSRVAYVFNLV